MAQCNATANSTGTRCNRRAILGGTVCQVHGGAAPQVKAAAKARLLEFIDPALSELRRILTDGENDTVRLRAAVEILNRTGLIETKRVEVITLDAITAEIERLKDELANNDPVSHG